MAAGEVSTAANTVRGSLSVSRIAVLVPTVALSIYLTQRGVPLGPRIMLTLMFGYMLIKAVSALMRATSSDV